MNKKTVAKKNTKNKADYKIKTIGEVVKVVRFPASIELAEGERLLDIETIQVPIIGRFKIPVPKKRQTIESYCCKKIKRQPTIQILSINFDADTTGLETLSIKVKAANPCGISLVGITVALTDFSAGEERLKAFMVDGEEARADMDFPCDAANIVVEGTLQVPANGLAGEEFRVFAIAIDCCGKSAEVLSPLTLIV